MPQPIDQIDWPAVDSDEFVQTLCVFAEHLSADELRGGVLTQIEVHGRSLVAHFERLILAERVADAGARAGIVAAIGWTGRDSSTTAIRAALGDESPEVLRAAAVAAWFDLREPRLIPRLLELLADRTAEPDVSLAAAQSLVEFRATEALPEMVRRVLVRVAGLDDEEREAMLRCVEQLAGVNFGDPDVLPLKLRARRLSDWWDDLKDASRENNR